MSQHIYTYDPVNGLEEIGGAGHIIEDAAGVTYAKRENLQFEGASVTDDSTNNKTVVTITETNFVGTMAEWNTLTADEKAQYKTVDLTDDFNGEPIDSELSTTSEHTVQNKVVTAAINGKAQTDHASSSATYGLGTAANYGHNKIIDDLSKTSLTSGEALSAHMGNSLGKMVATIESSSTASQAYAVGKQFVYNGILYKATSAISAGGTINPGTGGNCTPADSVTTQISNLENNPEWTAYNNYIIKSDTEYNSVILISTTNANAEVNKPHRVYQLSTGTAILGMPDDYPQGTGFVGFRFVHYFDVNNIVIELVSIYGQHPRYLRRWSSNTGWDNWYKSLPYKTVPEYKTVYSPSAASNASSIVIDSIAGYNYADVYLTASPASGYIYDKMVTIPTTANLKNNVVIYSSGSVTTAHYLFVENIGFSDTTHFTVYDFLRHTIETGSIYTDLNQIKVKKIVCHN